MPLQQPALTIIRKADFRKNIFSFPVESVVKGEQGVGKLHIEASAGYLLTTSSNPNPGLQQTIRYVLQPDGSRVASGTVTLVSEGPTLEAGTVTLSDPLGQQTVLTIDVSADSSLLPVLTVGSSALSFDKTDPGDESFAILKISQQYADTPLTVSVDEPANFLIATGIRQLTFLPSLTFTPPTDGTYIHVRYAPDRPGRHTAKLFVETPYDMKLVVLQGRAGGLLLPQRSERALPQPVIPDDQPPAQPRRLGLPALLVLSGLAFAGYTYRCELAPSLCQAQSGITPVEPSRAERPVDSVAAQNKTAVTDKRDARPDRDESRVTRAEVDRPDETRSESVPPAPKKKKRKSRPETYPVIVEPETEAVGEPSEVGEGEPVEPVAQAQQLKPVRQPEAKRRSRVARTAKTTESELEKELNKENFEPDE